MDIISFLKQVVDPVHAQWLVGSILLNLALGVLASMKAGEFDLGRLVDFWKRLGMLLAAYITVSVAATVLTDMEQLRLATWLLLEAYVGTRITKNLSDLGLPIPSFLRRWGISPPKPPSGIPSP